VGILTGPVASSVRIWPQGSTTALLEAGITGSGLNLTAAFIDPKNDIAEWQSADGGVTWTQTLTGPSLSLGALNSALWQFSADLSAVGYQDPLISSGNSFNIRLASESWNTVHTWPYDSVTYNGFGNFNFFRRSTGKYVVVQLAAIAASSIDAVILGEFDPVASTWNATTFLIAQGSMAHPDLVLASSILLSDDSILLILTNAGGSDFSVKIHPNNTADAPIDFPASNQSYGNQMVAVGSNIVATFFDSGTTHVAISIFNGTSWTLPIDLDTTITANNELNPTLVYDGSNLWLSYVDQATSTLRTGRAAGASIASPSAWSFSQVLDLTVPSPIVPTLTAPYDFTGMALAAIGGVPILLLQLGNATAEPGTFVLVAGSLSLPGPVSSGSSFLPGGAGGGRFKCCTSPHKFQGVRMAEVLRQTLKDRADWPYVHEFPPVGSIPVDFIADIPSPAVGVKTPVLVYQVPSGFRFFLAALLQDFNNAFNPGDALWTVDRNANPANTQGMSVQGLINVPVPLRRLLDGYGWELPRTYEFGPLDVVRSTVVNVNLGVGAPNFFTSGFFGYLVPVS
jgi:hypothetical protein